MLLAGRRASQSLRWSWQARRSNDKSAPPKLVSEWEGREWGQEKFPGKMSYCGAPWCRGFRCVRGMWLSLGTGQLWAV
jgi:hypothetical protein